ncbi:hypothetical protein D0Z00_004693 [Geotrichum galactomycetum]|uniref:Uncharacterized protein n=1 Tax=Geotrichum galactomycetum TaxID=27317 RepID=A0ACB6UXP8_9ASCO|nr:hypothetical protein D0Z00_004693 [Geotrichum candidum]
MADKLQPDSQRCWSEKRVTFSGLDEFWIIPNREELALLEEEEDDSFSFCEYLAEELYKEEKDYKGFGRNIASTSNANSTSESLTTSTAVMSNSIDVPHDHYAQHSLTTLEPASGAWDQSSDHNKESLSRGRSSLRKQDLPENASDNLCNGFPSQRRSALSKDVSEARDQIPALPLPPPPPPQQQRAPPPLLSAKVRGQRLAQLQQRALPSLLSAKARYQSSNPIASSSGIQSLKFLFLKV